MSYEWVDFLKLDFKVWHREKKISSFSRLIANLSDIINLVK